MRTIYTILLCLLCIPLSAQRTESLIHRADSTKTITGQSDEAYLSALSSAIQQAFGEGNNALANKLRSEHAEIVKVKYGELSVQYAEDIWRLGNVSSHLGREYQMSCYKKAKGIYEILDARLEFPYSQIMWELYLENYNNERLTVAIHYLRETIKYYQVWAGKEWNGVEMISELQLSHTYLILGNLLFLQKSLEASLEAYQTCTSRLEAHNHIAVYNYTIYPYRRIVEIYTLLNDNQRRVDSQTRVTEITKQLYGELSDEYIDALDYLTSCHFTNSDLDSIKKNIRNILKIIEDRNKINSIDSQLDSVYLGYQNKIISYCIAFSDWAGVVQEAEVLAKIYHTQKQTYSYDYWNLLNNLILGYNNTGDFLKAASLFSECEAIAEVLALKDKEEYYDYLTIKSELCSNLYQKEEYKVTIDELTKLNHNLYGEFSFQSAMQETIFANHSALMQCYEDAINHVEKCYHILDTKECTFANPSDSLMITSNLHNIEGMIYTSSNPNYAERLLKSALDEFLITGQNPYAPLNNLGLLYQTIKRDFTKATECFSKAKEALELNGDNHSIHYITVLSNLALCYQGLGQSSLAISTFDLLEPIIHQFYGTEHVMYANVMLNKSSFYASISDHKTAIKYGEIAKMCMANIFGVDSEKYASCLLNLGLFYQNNGQWDKSKEYLLSAERIFRNTNKVYAIQALTNLLAVYYNENDLDSFNDAVHKCFDDLKELNIEDSDIAVSFIETVGYYLLLHGRTDSKDYLGHALDIINMNGNTDSPGYIADLTYYYLAHFLDNTYNESIIKTLTSSYKKFYQADAGYYNTFEREMLHESQEFKNIKDIIFSSRIEGEKDSELYDFLLFNKGLLLGTSLSYVKAIYNSANEEVISQYRELVELNKFLSGENMSLVEYTMEEAKARASVLEREITLYLRQNGGYTDELSYTYNDVRQSLSANEMAVEFVSYNNYVENCTNYAALVLMKDFEKPVFVKLGKAEDVENFASLAPNKIYSESSISQELYDQIWAPIINVAPTAKKIIFSPAGVLNKIAIEQLYNGKRRVCESYDLARVTSTREICRKTPQYKYSTAVLYGGLNYDEEIDTMIAESKSVRGDMISASERFRGYTSSVTRKGWDYLPGTLSEINEVSSIFTKGNVSHSLYSAEKGNEESFKALSGDKFDILHIATHGFYMSETQASRSYFFTRNPFMGNNLNVNTSSLYRSGLMMSGGNKAWVGGTLPDGIEDGILSAAEICNLDFNSCDIVVLSACDTGLGEITDEGVFGLQRSFKIAGVNTIIMSLWEVDDQATSYMMQNFYKNLVKGKNKREAFSIAQAAVKKKYSDPRYWAAFIMLD